MDVNYTSTACSSCHSILPELGSSKAASKLLDCKHTLCTQCFATRIRILHKDKIMILKCPIVDCRAVTTRSLPANYCSAAKKPAVRRNKGSNIKIRPVETGKLKRRHDDILLEQFNDALPAPQINVKSRSVLDTDIEWTMFGVKTAYMAVLLSLGIGFVWGFDTFGFFDTLHFYPVDHSSYTSSNISLSATLLLLFMVEFLPDKLYSAHKDSLNHLLCLDFVLICAMCAGLSGFADFGASHSLGVYLSMSLSSHALVLLVLSVGLLQIVSVAVRVAHGTCKYVASTVTGFYQPRPVLTTTATCAKPVSAVRKKMPEPTASSSKATTVRTIGFEYDSRYVCAPKLLRIKPNTDSNSKQNKTTNSATPSANTATSPPADLSPSVKSEHTTSEERLAMNFLVDGYAWNDGINTTTTNNTINNTTNNTINIAIPTSDNQKNQCEGSSDAKELEQYDNREGEHGELVSSAPVLVEFVSNNCLLNEQQDGVVLDSVAVDALPSVQHYDYFPDTGTVDDNSMPTSDAELSMEAERIIEDTVDFSPLSPSTYNPIHSVCGVDTIVLDEPVSSTSASENIHNSTMSSLTVSLPTEDSPPDSHKDTHSLSYSAGVSPISSTNSLQYSMDSGLLTPKHTTQLDNSNSNSNTNTTNTNNTTLLYTPYTNNTTSNNNNDVTIDVYNHPTPVFRVPKIPSPYQDLSVSPFVTPTKDNSGINNAHISTCTTDNTAVYSNCMYYGSDNTITPVSTPSSSSTTTFSTLPAGMCTPLHTTSNSKVGSPEEDDVFRLHSNIKLKPLGLNLPIRSTHSHSGSIDNTYISTDSYYGTVHSAEKAPNKNKPLSTVYNNSVVSTVVNSIESNLSGQKNSDSVKSNKNKNNAPQWKGILGAPVNMIR